MDALEAVLREMAKPAGVYKQALAAAARNMPAPQIASKMLTLLEEVMYGRARA